MSITTLELEDNTRGIHESVRLSMAWVYWRGNFLPQGFRVRIRGSGPCKIGRGIDAKGNALQVRRGEGVRDIVSGRM